MHDGRIVGEVPQATATEQAIGLMMAGVPAEEPEARAAAPGPVPSPAGRGPVQ
jgi:hypothetical protein